MKKIAFMLLASAFLVSCGGNSDATENTTPTDSTSVCCDSTKSVCADTCKTVESTATETSTVK